MSKKWPNKTAVHISTSEIKCFNCAGAHTIYRCPSLLTLSENDHVKKVGELKLCQICLRSHPNIKCQARYCAKCSRPHNSLLHFTKTSNSTSENHNLVTNEATANNTLLEQSKSSVQPSTTMNSHASEVETIASVLLATAVVKVSNKDGKSITCRVLLDTGSQNNFMTEEVCQLLNLQCTKISCSVVGIGQTTQRSSYAVSAVIESLVSDYKTTY